MTKNRILVKDYLTTRERLEKEKREESNALKRFAKKITKVPKTKKSYT